MINAMGHEENSLVLTPPAEIPAIIQEARTVLEEFARYYEIPADKWPLTPRQLKAKRKRLGDSLAWS